MEIRTRMLMDKPHGEVQENKGAFKVLIFYLTSCKIKKQDYYNLNKEYLHWY